jgi:hypothetical protein
MLNIEIKQKNKIHETRKTPNKENRKTFMKLNFQII